MELEFALLDRSCIRSVDRRSQIGIEFREFRELISGDAVHRPQRQLDRDLPLQPEDVFDVLATEGETR